MSFYSLEYVLFMGSAALATLAIAVLICMKAMTTPHPVYSRSEAEHYFEDAENKKRRSFPTIHEEPSVDLTVVIPAYDEELRLPMMLDEATEYLESKRKATGSTFSYEIIVVSDGSKDRTVEVAQKYGKTLGSDKFRVLALETNRGKGGAVRLGVQSARGKLILFADADGATHFPDLDKLTVAMNKFLSSEPAPKEAIVIGSRAHLEDDAIAERSFFRTILMHGFHLLVWLFAVRGIRDTQCGFKLFTRSAANVLFELMHVERWAFDVEVLFIAQHFRIPIAEVAVQWTEIDGSKVTPVWSWIQMGRDLFLIWFRYAIGAWSLVRPAVAEKKKL